MEPDIWHEVVAWFGRVPRFHDCEVVSISLRRQPEPITVCIHAFLMTSDTDERGHYLLDEHALVTFRLCDVLDQELDGWNHQNVIDSLAVEKIEGGYHLDWRAHTAWTVRSRLAR